jgi:hypothetical protein
VADNDDPPRRDARGFDGPADGGFGVESEATFGWGSSAEAEAAVVDGQHVVRAVRTGEGAEVLRAVALGELGCVSVDWNVMSKKRAVGWVVREPGSAYG